MTTEITTIDTEHGDALVWFDAESDPQAAGWVLRYSNGDQDNLDEILNVEPDDRDGDLAVAEAVRFLTRNGIAVR